MVSGMTIHAQLLEELQEEQSQGLIPPIALALQLLLVAGFAWALVWARTAKHLVLVGLSLVTAWSVLIAFGASMGSAAPLTAGLWSIAVLVCGLAPMEWLADRARVQNISRVLSRYVTPPILKAIIAEPTQDPLRPRSAQITVLTLDMVNYSSHTATLNLDDAARLTRQFLTAMTDPIWAEAGTLDRYTGDGLVAFWGAPLDQPDQIQRAARAARGLRRALGPLNDILLAQGMPPVDIRIGIACGEALVGDMGTDHRAHYTAVGACINLASRLEALGKELGQNNLVSQEVALSLASEETEAIGSYDIKGFGPTSVFMLSISAGS
jgi:adenylate cyclase